MIWITKTGLRDFRALEKIKEFLRVTPKRIDELEYQKVKQKVKMGIFKDQSLQLPINKYKSDMAKASGEIPGLE